MRHPLEPNGCWNQIVASLTFLSLPFPSWGKRWPCSKSTPSVPLVRGERETREAAVGSRLCSGWLNKRPSRVGLLPWAASHGPSFFWLFNHFFKYFELVLDFFFKIKLDVVKWVNMYYFIWWDKLMSLLLERARIEVKNWRQGWCDSGRPLPVS